MFETPGIKVEGDFSRLVGSKMSDYNNNCLVRCGLCGDDEYKGVALMSGSLYAGKYACNMCVAYSHSSSNPWVCDEFKKVCPFCACDKGLDFDCGYYGASHNIKKNFKCCERCYNEIAKPFNEYIDKALKRADEIEAKKKAEETEETEMMCRRCEVIAVHRTQKICDLCEEGNC